MEFPAYIARRYLRSRRHSRFLGRGSVTAIVGIAIGVAVLNVTLAIMNGFHSEMRRTFVENMPMVSVVTSDPAGFSDLDGIMTSVRADEEVTGATPVIRQEAIVSAELGLGRMRHRGVVVWGVDPAGIDRVQPLREYLLPDASVLDELGRAGAPRVILGADLANSLYAARGDTVVITAPSGDLDPADLEAESRRFVVTGFFETGMYEFDSRFVYVDLGPARDFFGYGSGGASLVAVKVDDLMRADRVADRLEDTLGREFYATDWMALNANLFQWIKLEKIIMALLLGMIILIAGFNIIGILTMMVGERRREIGILLAMGTSRSRIMGIFLFSGMWLGAVGVAVGSLVGLAGIWALSTFGIELPGDVYFVETVPVLLQWTDFGLVAVVSVLMALVAGLWPSWEASNLRPMDIIRYT
ncbi:MAG: ABC transporter permease [bacterium]|nr:ABC transporter permease [bacterium]